jgi:hypothetical protein
MIALRATALLPSIRAHFGRGQPGDRSIATAGISFQSRRGKNFLSTNLTNATTRLGTIGAEYH